jgi:hypothetical protein
MKPIKPPDPGLFDSQEPTPLPTIGESREEFERDRAALGHGPQPTTDVAELNHARVPGHCVKELMFWTGNVAVKVGPVEIEYAPKMVYVLVSGRMGFTFSREHAVDMDKFNQYFKLDDAEQIGGAA